jgi:3-hydroxyisobutyrate dehydrogenase-like beta-hydroxyacid dehydrogenase
MRLRFVETRRRRSKKMSDNPTAWKVGLVGYGEVGRILSEDLRKANVAVAAYDIKLDGEQAAPLRAHAAKFGVVLAKSHADLAGHSDLIISAVTASQAVTVAQACAPAIRQGTWYLDFNSASPGAKQRAAALIHAAHGRYVEAP